MSMRLAKFLASAGIASRRKSEQLIIDKLVKVNGVYCTNVATNVNPAVDQIECRGAKVQAMGDHFYIALNKPRGYVSSTKPERNAPSVMELLPQELVKGIRMYPIGRLDKDSEGLLLLTNDGDLANMMTHPRYKLDKEYEVSLDRPISQEDLRMLRKGVQLSEGFSKPDELQIIHVPPARTKLSIVLHEGKKHQIRKMFFSLGYRVEKLVRVRIGALHLGHLKIGAHKQIKKPTVTTNPEGKL